MSIRMPAALRNYRVSDQRLVLDTGIARNLKHFFSTSYHTAQVKRVAEFFTASLKTAQGDARKELLAKADAFIQHYGKDKSVAKIIKEFDKAIYPLRESATYLHPQNRQTLAKWTRASQPAELFQHHEFAEFLERSKLLSQMKVTRDTLRMIDDEPAMLVEGEWTKWSAIKTRFQIEDSQVYGTQFVTDSTGQVYTYLDNRKGLQKYHPYQTIGEVPISVLEENEVETLRGVANQFVRPDESHLSQEERDQLNAERPFVMQIVTSYTDRGSSNFAETVLNPRHAYMRIVAGADLPEYNVKKGDVFEFGFGWKRGVLLPMEATQGLFCSPDPWEYVPCDKRVVTCMPISAENAAAGFDFALRQQRKHVQLGREIGFHLAQQNCTVFDRKIAEHAGVEIPTEIQLKPLLFRILPDFLKRLGEQIATYTAKASTCLQEKVRVYTPGCVGEKALCCMGKIATTYGLARDALTAFVLLPLRTLLGGWYGLGGESFDEGDEIQAPSRNPKNWFDLSSYRYNLPVILQEWQKEQGGATFVVDKPIRLALLPSL